MFLVATYYFLFSGFVGSGSESFDTDTDLDPAQLFIRIRIQENYTDSVRNTASNVHVRLVPNVTS